ncbi:Hint domain-containing protein [Rhizobium sp.]|uniref:Hint domain-containing protein n=1 Tax=Rhizobium sp. TaxID=391 RepID=UPI002F04607B
MMSSGIDNGEVVMAPMSEVPASFVSGTRIRTPRGEIAVEHLIAGDLVITATGNVRAIVSIGSQTIRKPARAYCPVQIKAQAFPGDIPRRDLLLSPGHAVCVRAVDEVLIPIGQLINDATVASVDVDEVTYWSLELESRAVLLVEGLGCESCLNCSAIWLAGAPLTEQTTAVVEQRARSLVNGGAVVAAIRQRLLSRAESMGWRHATGMDPHLIVDGRRVEPTIDGNLAAFIFPADAKEAILASHIWVPADDGASWDKRTLGLSIHGLTFLDGLRVNRQVSLDEVEGLYPEEAVQGCAWRWTNGRLSLPPDLWADCRGHAILRVAFDPDAGRAWIPPVTTPKREPELRRALMPSPEAHLVSPADDDRDTPAATIIDPAHELFAGGPAPDHPQSSNLRAADLSSGGMRLGNLVHGALGQFRRHVFAPYRMVLTRCPTRHEARSDTAPHDDDVAKGAGHIP